MNDTIATTNPIEAEPLPSDAPQSPPVPDPDSWDAVLDLFDREAPNKDDR